MVCSVGLGLTLDVLKPFLSIRSPLLSSLEKLIYGCQAEFTEVTKPKMHFLMAKLTLSKG